jgi:hypothetical protein
MAAPVAVDSGDDAAPATTGPDRSIKVDLRPKPSRSWILIVAIAVAGAVALAYYVR